MFAAWPHYAGAGDKLMSDPGTLLLKLIESLFRTEVSSHASGTTFPENIKIKILPSVQAALLEVCRPAES